MLIDLMPFDFFTCGVGAFSTKGIVLEMQAYPSAHRNSAPGSEHGLQSLDLGRSGPDGMDFHNPLHRLLEEAECGTGPMAFRAGLADGEYHLVEALDFVRQNYRLAGYVIPESLAPTASESITAMAKRHHKVIGTLSLWRDGPEGLQADEIYGSELDSLRQRGARIGEIGRLAMDSRTPPLTLLLSMVGKAVKAGCDLWHTTDLVVECNPRHVGFYTRKLGFSVVGGERDFDQVGAPAVLLHVASSHLLHLTHQFGFVPRIKGLPAEETAAEVLERKECPRPTLMAN